MPNPMRDAAIQDALKNVFADTGAMTPEQYGLYLEALVIVAVGGMRGCQGDAMVRGFLEAALHDLEKPGQAYIKPAQPQQRH
ncbi:hypothetical protein LG302_00840 [Halomonas organivorans]